jgi:putative sterol carrier protein
MVAYLSQGWLDRQVELLADLPPRPGASARTQTTVGKAPGGDASYVTVVEDGRLVSATLGTDDAADLAVTIGYADAVAVAKGELDPDAAFMQGRLKVVGSMGTVMDLIPMTSSPEHRAAQAQLAAETEFA